LIVLVVVRSSCSPNADLLHQNTCDVNFRRDGNNERALQYTPEVGKHRGTFQQDADLYPRRGDIDYPDVGERFLPRPLITKFDGHPMNYKTFMRQFEAHIAQGLELMSCACSFCNIVNLQYEIKLSALRR